MPPVLQDLPAPPEGRTGWPWTDAGPAPRPMTDGGSLPRISIVTPSYNQAPYLEATIRSVLLQGYPELECIVIDGGSSDASAEILRKYDAWLAHWTTEPDRGQSDAVNKGFARATGEIYAWLNSDDVHEPGALAEVGEYFARTPECRILYGRGSYIDEEGRKTGSCDWIRPFDRRLFLTSNFILQPAAFWRADLWEEVGELDVDCHWAMDWEWLLRATAVARPHFLPVELASWRIGPEIKTRSGGEQRRAEIAAVSRRHGGRLQPTYLIYLLDRASWRVSERLGDGLAFRFVRHLATPVRWLLKDKLWGRRYQA